MRAKSKPQAWTIAHGKSGNRTANRSEIYRAFELLGAGRELLGTIGSWGDTLDDKEVLTLLKDWNADESRRGKIASNWF